MMGSRWRRWHGDHDGLGRVIVCEGRCGGLWLITESHCNQKLLVLVKSLNRRVFLTAGVPDGIVSEGVVIAVIVGFSG